VALAVFWLQTALKNRALRAPIQPDQSGAGCGVFSLTGLLVRFTEKRPQMHQPWLKERRSPCHRPLALLSFAAMTITPPYVSTGLTPVSCCHTMKHEARLLFLA
jgi:hypothetical protein